MADSITITIDGQECVGERGMTILEVAKANDVDIPTLCHHPWLSNHGACRMCCVQVEGNPRLVTSCAAPAEDGMTVTAHSERLSLMRQMTLELLFAERNHICPFCPMTGVCELQNRAYEEGITHTRYDYLFPVLEPDTTGRYFVQDHNRCILCGRCVRACNEVVGIGTLGFGQRGSRELVIADLGVPLGESSCLACGTCVDVCPTGSLFEKRAPYFSKGEGLDRHEFICPDDDMGCVMNVVLKSGLVARIEGNEHAPVNGPLLSERSRYRILDEPTPRLLAPHVRNGAGELVEVSWDEALDAAAAKLAPVVGNGAGRPVAGLCSGRLPLETLDAFHGFITDACHSGDLDTLYGAQRATRRAAVDLYGEHLECDYDAIREADMVLLIGFDPPTTHQVLGAWLAHKRLQEHRPIVSINSRHAKVSELSELAIKPRRGSEQTVVLGILAQLLDVGKLSRRVDRDTQERWRAHPPARVAVEAHIDGEDVVRAAELYAHAHQPVILYGPDLGTVGNPTVIGLLWDMARLSGHITEDGALRVRGFQMEANAAAAELAGFRAADLQSARAVYLLQGDDPFVPSAQLEEELDEAPAVVLQASHEGPLMAYADVVLPSLKWSERGGTWISATGLRQSFARCTTPPQGIRDDEEVLGAIAQRLAAVPLEVTHE